MNQPRPFLTAICVVLFAAVFVSSNVRPASLCGEAICSAEPGALQRLAGDVMHALYQATRARND